MKAKEYMREVAKIDKMIKNKMIEVQQWKNIATTCAINMGEKVQTSKKPDPMADAVCEYTDLENEIRKDIDELTEKKMSISHTIEKLQIEEYDILHIIYIQGRSLKEAAAIGKRGYSFTANLHGRALKHLQDILDERECNSV